MNATGIEALVLLVWIVPVVILYFVVWRFGTESKTRGAIMPDLNGSSLIRAPGDG